MKQNPAFLKAYVKVSHAIECHFCGDTEYCDKETRIEATEVFYHLGWREVTSKTYQVVAAACPTCFKNNEYEKLDK